jgi:hypothetical protein
MKATFDITKLWQSKAKQTIHKDKQINTTHSKAHVAIVSWEMSSEDALRVPYSGHK